MPGASHCNKKMTFRIRNVIFFMLLTMCPQKDTISLAGLVVAAMLLTYSTGPSP